MVIISVGRLTEVKGTRYLIRAVGQVPAHIPVHLVLIGGGPLLREFVQLTGSNPKITLAGEQPPEQVRRYLRASDLFVLPSVDLHGHCEGVSTAALEAMATGLPIVVTDSGGTQGVIEPVKGVTTVPQRDSIALASAVEAFACSATMRSEVGRANRSRAAFLDWSAVAVRVTEFYARILAERVPLAQ